MELEGITGSLHSHTVVGQKGVVCYQEALHKMDGVLEEGVVRLARRKMAAHRRRQLLRQHRHKDNLVGSQGRSVSPCRLVPHLVAEVLV